MNNIITIKQVTRNAARHTLRNFKQAGKVACIVDNGKHLKGLARWAVAVENTQTVKPVSALKAKQKARTEAKTTNKGFCLRKVKTGVKGFDVYYNGEFLLRECTKIAAYEKALTMAHKNNLETSTLNYR